MFTTNPPGPPYATTPVEVTISSSTPNAVIFFTTDGTNPTVTSQRYVGPLKVSVDTTFLAVAVFPGFTNSDTVKYEIDISPQPLKVATPTITTSPPGPGPYTTSPIQVTIATATPNAVIFFTTDGTNPTVTSQRYVGPFFVSVDTTVIALAVFPGFINSDKAVAVIDINVTGPSLTPPAFSPTSGSYTNTFLVAVTTPTADGSNICYTTDGVSDPTCTNGVCGPGSTLYVATAPVPVNTTNTSIRALACKSGASSTAAVSATYTLRVSPITASPAPPGGPGPTTVTLTTLTQNGVIHYTTNGASVNCGNGMTATGTTTVTVSPGTTIKAIGCKTGFLESIAQSFVY